MESSEALALFASLAEQLSHQNNPEDILQSGLSQLQGAFPNSCAEALRLGDQGRLEELAVRGCPYPDTSQCPVRDEVRQKAAAALARGQAQTEGDLNLIPINGQAIIALRSPEVPAELSHIGSHLLGYAWEKAQLSGALAQKERQRRELASALLRAQEAERARISRDLHDQVAQLLTGIKLGLEALGSSPKKTRLDSLKELADLALSDVRRIASALRPALLEQLGLKAALERFSQSVAEQGNLEVETLIILNSPLAPELEQTLFLVAQEALHNVLYHAQAQQVSLVLTEKAGQIRLVVEDDGVGFDTKNLPQARLGVTGMRERMALVGGTLTIESTPGQGTTLFAQAPLEPA